MGGREASRDGLSGSRFGGLVGWEFLFFLSC